jgi:lipopolysaccharide/colanic/teichoic acid biosynthesis glycosyltransferase
MIYNLSKRVLDMVVAVIILVIFSPVFLLTPLLIKLSSPGPVFADIPRRIGKNRKLFRLYKFRSMVPNAHELLKRDVRYKKLYQKYLKNNYKLAMEEDPRITKIGLILRKYSLDELPQVFNVLKGEMSIVGPRAYYQDELDKQQVVFPQTESYIKKLLTVKPGITGRWQVNGRNEVDFAERVKMDAAYAESRSIIEDVKIILKTPYAMFSGKGAL